ADAGVADGGHPLLVAQVRDEPGPEDGGEGPLVRVEQGPSGEEDVVLGVPDQPVGPRPADEDVTATAADPQAVPGPANQDVGPPPALEPVVPVITVETQGRDDVPVRLDVVVPGQPVNNQPPGRAVGADQGPVHPHGQLPGRPALLDVNLVVPGSPGE